MSTKKNKAPTIYDLAKLADVSPGTVSRVLNNKDKVNPQTRARVLGLAHEIGLKPRASARNKEIAVITEPHYTDRFKGYSNVLTSHVAFSLSEKNVSMLLPSDPIKQLPHYFIDGVIAITCEPEIQAMLKEVEKKVPVVYLDNFEATPEQYVICSDHYQSGYKAALHFIDRGMKNLAFISGDTIPAKLRLKGYQDGIKEAGLSLDNKLQVLMTEEESLYTIVSRVVKNGADALFTPGSSMQGIEALHVLQNVMNLRIPEDISIIGGENYGVSMFLHPPMTTLSEPLESMAKAAVDMVLTLSDKKPVQEHMVSFPVEVIERDSVR